MSALIAVGLLWLCLLFARTLVLVCFVWLCVLVVTICVAFCWITVWVYLCLLLSLVFIGRLVGACVGLFILVFGMVLFCACCFVFGWLLACLFGCCAWVESGGCLLVCLDLRLGVCLWFVLLWSSYLIV